MEETWCLTEKSDPPIFGFSYYIKHKTKEIFGFHEHFSVSFFTKFDRAHQQVSVQSGIVPVLPPHLPASLLDIEPFWFSSTQRKTNNQTNTKALSAVVLNALLLLEHFNEVLESWNSVRRQARVCAFKWQLSSSGYFSKTLSCVNTYMTSLIFLLNLTNWLLHLALGIQHRGCSVPPVLASISMSLLYQEPRIGHSKCGLVTE